MTELGLEDGEVAFDGVEPGVVDFWGLVVHGDEVFVVLSDLLVFGLITGFEGELLKEVFQADGVGDIFGGEAVFESFELGHVTELEAFFDFFEHDLFCLP